MKGREWYNLTVNEAFQHVNSSPLGLTEEVARRRLETYGPNELLEVKAVSPLRIFLSQFLNLLVLILVLAATVSAAIGYFNNSAEELIDAGVIMSIVVLNAVFGFVQEFKAERAIQALKALAAPRATVIREGDRRSIPASELVPGDLVLLEAGDKVPADARLVEVANLRVNEASLTGESIPIRKSIDPVTGDVYVGDRTNMLFMGCTVEVGRGRALVVSTGMQTELGKIAGMVQEERVEDTPLQRRLANLAKQIGLGVLAASVIIFVVGLTRAVDIVLMFLTAVSLAVAAIPEGLPAVVTITLALGLQRMARRNALIRRLPAAETLGSATVICSDKTGTLTLGEMNIRRIFTLSGEYQVEGRGFVPEGKFLVDGDEVNPLDDQNLSLLLKAGMLCTNASVVKDGSAWGVLGDTTEGTLIVAGMRAGLRKEDLEQEEPRVGEIGFDSVRKRMTTIHRGDGVVAYVKGAPEVLLQLSSRVLAEEEVELDEGLRSRILEENRAMASQALRVLAIAYRQLPEDLEGYEEEVVERDLVFLGLVGMMDAPRKDAVEAVAECKRAGIQVVMITGDHKLTAVAVAREMGIIEEEDGALTGEELERMDDEELYSVADRVRVYARVSPHHKVRIVDALKHEGHIVAMTGDGVNDAPALKRADIGVAMGITGTDVAKEASDMILTDDNFASIVRAIEEGRGIFDNIRKFVGYLLSANAGEVLVMFLATMIFVQHEFLPFLEPIQLLWINLVTDGLPALALGVDPVAKDIMGRPPRSPKESPLNREVAGVVLAVGLVMAIAALFAFQWQVFGRGDGSADVVERGRTTVFTLIVVFELFFVFSIRSLREPIHRTGPLSNPWLVVAVLASLVLQLLVIYVPILQIPFKTTPLALDDWLLIIFLSILLIVGFEAWKVMRGLVRQKSREPGRAPP
ncbi:MAG: cation-translocating P-type ATPase [Thermoplasmata archaeon]